MTPRQHTVLRLLARGLGTHEISRKLRISPYTLENHIKPLLREYGVRNRTQLVVRALQRGVVRL